MTEFESIRPYSDKEAVEALARVSRHPMMPVISKYLFPKEKPNFLAKAISGTTGVDDFQYKVMSSVVTSILARTSEGFTWSGAENLHNLAGKKFLAISNHRDIVIDPALTQYLMFSEGLPMTQICVGDNLLKSRLIEDLMRSNRMIKVLRGLGPRELYKSSQILSAYIRNTITSGEASIWIAQREGRTKDGLDSSEQGLVKMFDMSGNGSFEENFSELCIVPMSISYEYESCDARKARELLIRETTGKYVKKKNEDTHSILTGVRQRKGHIHLSIGKPVTGGELSAAASTGKSANDHYMALCRILDNRIISGYRLWKTNYMGYDLAHGTTEFLGVKYLPEELKEFKAYTEHKLGKLERKLDSDRLHRIFWDIYGNPVVSKENLTE